MCACAHGTNACTPEYGFGAAQCPFPNTEHLRFKEVVHGGAPGVPGACQPAFCIHAAILRSCAACVLHRLPASAPIHELTGRPDIRAQAAAAVGPAWKILRLDNASIGEAHQPMLKAGPEWLHQIINKAFVAVGIAVEPAQPGMQFLLNDDQVESGRRQMRGEIEQRF